MVNILETVAKDPTSMIGKKRRCLTEAERYGTENVVKILIERLER